MLTALAGPSLWGVKDSGGDIANTKAVLAAGANVMVGSERTLVEAVVRAPRAASAAWPTCCPSTC